MERGLIKHFYKRPHADQILVTFGLAIVLQEVIKYYFGANPIQTPAPDAMSGVMNVGAVLGLDLPYPIWRITYFLFSLLVISGVFAFLQFTTFGMVVRAGMADRETVQMLGINIDLIAREVSIGAPSSQWWTQLSASVAGGLAFATILTLLLTPSLLMIQANVSAHFAERRAHRDGDRESVAAG